MIYFLVFVNIEHLMDFQFQTFRLTHQDTVIILKYTCHKIHFFQKLYLLHVYPFLILLH